MDLDTTEGYFSDDEVFIGKLTMKEIRKRLFPSGYGCTPTENFKYTTHNEEDDEKSFELIEAHSAPSLVCNSMDSPGSNESESSPVTNVKVSPQDQPDDSFLQMEKLVSEICASEERTVDKVVYNTPAIKKYLENSKLQELKNDLNVKIICTSVAGKVDDKINEKEPEKICDDTNTPKTIKNRQAVNTPINLEQKDMFFTPGSELKTRSPIFKTPLMSASKKKLNTPAKYQHIVSPVATYIKQSPVVPLMKDVCPKKALKGGSSIPKSVKHSSENNKENCKIKQIPMKQENIKLPSLAYKSAKETEVIHVRDEGKLPQSQWAKQVASSIPRAVVLSHNARLINSARPILNTEESFENLSLHQADLSLCTQKSALSRLIKKH